MIPPWQRRRVGARAAVVENALLQAPSERKARMRALAALHNMSAITANKTTMWRDVSGARAALIAAARLGSGDDKKAWRGGAPRRWGSSYGKVAFAHLDLRIHSQSDGRAVTSGRVGGPMSGPMSVLAAL